MDGSRRPWWAVDGVESAVGLGVWAAACVVAVAALAGASVRVVTPGEHAAVLRGGRLVRTSGPGVVLCVPVVEHVVRIPMDPVHMPLVVRAVTRDGIPVRLLATAVCRTVEPSRWAGCAATLERTALAVEAAVETAVGAQDVANLVSSEQMQHSIAAQVSAAVTEWGVELVQLQVDELEAPLTPELMQLLGPR